MSPRSAQHQKQVGFPAARCFHNNTAEPIKSQLVMDITLRSSTLQTLPSSVFLRWGCPLCWGQRLWDEWGLFPCLHGSLATLTLHKPSQAPPAPLLPLIFAPNKCAVYSLFFSFMETHLMLYEYQRGKN